MEGAKTTNSACPATDHCFIQKGTKIAGAVVGPGEIVVGPEYALGLKALKCPLSVGRTDIQAIPTGERQRGQQVMGLIAG
jgi:hypothetical protein